MTVIATALKHMLAAGMPAEAIVAAVAEMEAGLAAQVPAEAQPSKGALRTRAWRARHASSQTVTGDAPVTVETENVTAPLSLSPNENISNPHTHTPERDTPRSRKAAAWPCPPGVEPQHWADMLANRKTRRLTNTETAYRGQLEKLAELSDEEWPPGRLVKHAAEKGWGAIHDPRDEQDRRNDRSTFRRPDHRLRSRSGPVDGFTAALREASDRAA